MQGTPRFGFALTGFFIYINYSTMKKVILYMPNGKTATFTEGKNNVLEIVQVYDNTPMPYIIVRYKNGKRITFSYIPYEAHENENTAS